MDQLSNLNLGNFNLNNIDLSKLKVNTKGYENVNLSPEHEKMINNVGQLIDDVRTSNVLKCDSECQRNEKEKLLYNDYLEAKQRVENAPQILEEAERNFYEFSKGTKAYSQLREKEFKADANANASKIVSSHNKLLEKTQNLINQYKTQQGFIDELDDAIDIYENNIASLSDKEHTEKNEQNIDNRLNYYKLQQEGTLLSINAYLRYVYYIVVLIFGAVFIIINGKFSDYRLWSKFIALFLFPTVFSFLFEQYKNYS